MQEVAAEELEALRQQIEELQDDLEDYKKTEERLTRQIKEERERTQEARETGKLSYETMCYQHIFIEKLKSKLTAEQLESLAGENTLVAGEEEPAIAPQPNPTATIPQPVEESESVAVEQADAAEPDTGTGDDVVTVEAVTEEATVPLPAPNDDAVNSPDDSGKVVAGEIPASLNQQRLAKRLGCNPTTVLRNKTKPDFTDWSRKEDPNGIAWRFDKEKNLFVQMVED